MGTRLLEFGVIRLVINQSVVPVELESSPKDRSYLSAVCCLRLYSFILSMLYIKHCLLILSLFVVICEFDFLGSHMQHVRWLVSRLISSADADLL